MFFVRRTCLPPPPPTVGLEVLTLTSSVSGHLHGVSLPLTLPQTHCCGRWSCGCRVRPTVAYIAPRQSRFTPLSLTVLIFPADNGVIFTTDITSTPQAWFLLVSACVPPCLLIVCQLGKPAFLVAVPEEAYLCQFADSCCLLALATFSDI